MGAPIGFPTINGLDVGHSSVRLVFGGVPAPISGIKDFSFDDELKPGKARGTSAQVQSRSRGTYDANGSISFYLSHWAAVLQYLVNQSAARGLGWKELAFDIPFSFAEPSSGILIANAAKSCRITKNTLESNEDGNVTGMKCSLDIIQIDWGTNNGQIGPPSISNAILP